jgi:hypothetical protein
VLNWNGAAFLPACLDALRAQTRPARIVVVDNGSADGSFEVVRARPGVAWYPLGRNAGFGAGNNAGIALALRARARWIALVNNDAVLAPDWLARTAAAADGAPRAALVNGLSLFADDPARVSSTGLVFDPLLRAADRDFGVPAAALARADGPAPGATAAAVLLRAEALREVGLLDPDYFVYCDDADLSLRAARAGWRSWYVSSAVAWHGVSRTTGEDSPGKRYLLARNHLRLAASHLPLAAAVAAVPALAALRAGVRAPLDLARGRAAHAVAHARAARDGLAAAAGIIAARLRARP